MTRIKTLLTAVIIIVQSLIDMARRDPEFAEAIRTKVLRVIPKQYKEEADVLLKRILNIRAGVIEFNRYDNYSRRNKYRPRN